MAVSFFSVFAVSLASIPDSVAVWRSQGADSALSLPFVSIGSQDDSIGALSCGNTEYRAQARLWGLPVKSVTVNVYDDDLRLYPGGSTFGIRMSTKGVVVVGISEVESSDGKSSPALSAGLCISDLILTVDGKAVNSASEVTDCIAQFSGEALTLGIERDGKSMEVKLTPVKSIADGFYRAGLWIRDGTAGIGTMTYINPEDMTFGGLGHGVCDADTGELMPLGAGTVFPVTVSGIVRGKDGSPGEIKGYFSASKTGVLTSNCNTGVYGVLAEEPKDCESVEIALEDEIKNGEAIIRCALDDAEVHEYTVQVEKLAGKSEEKNMVVRVTDPVLLEKTGGIIQGMSGSPILQGGKLIGAVTHVLISDPTCGYGIYIENMLESAA